MLKLGLAGVFFTGGWIAQADTSANFFAQLGIAGAVAAVVWLWQRDTAKQRDRLMEAHEAIQPVLLEVQHALQRSNEAHKAGTEAAKQLSSALQALPESKVWYTLERALERLERLETAERRAEG